MLFNEPRAVSRLSTRWLAPALGVALLALLGGSAFAARGLVQDRRVTTEEAQRLAAHGPSAGDGIPITVNDLVVRRLNEIVGTPEGRESFQRGLARMPMYRAMIERKLAAKGFPREVLAMPMNESRFRNDVISGQPYRARGLWQFIEPTARTYGLVINDRMDQRLDPELETDAAVAYLSDLMDEFGDWLLAFKAYNEGEKRVRAMIEQYHTRDAWALERISSSEDYLASTVATILVMRNPELLAN